jgi:hypothetical protein
MSVVNASSARVKAKIAVSSRVDGRCRPSVNTIRTVVDHEFDFALGGAYHF